MQIKCELNGKTLCLSDKFTNADNKFNKTRPHQDTPEKYLQLYSSRYSQKSFEKIPTSPIF